MAYQKTFSRFQKTLLARTEKILKGAPIHTPLLLAFNSKADAAKARRLYYAYRHHTKSSVLNQYTITIAPNPKSLVFTKKTGTEAPLKIQGRFQQDQAQSLPSETPHKQKNTRQTRTPQPVSSCLHSGLDPALTSRLPPPLTPELKHIFQTHIQACTTISAAAKAARSVCTEPLDILRLINTWKAYTSTKKGAKK